MTARRRRIAWASIALCAAILTVAGWAAHQRYVRKNFHAVVEGQVYRSAQPTPEDLREWARQYGLRSVLTLQGTDGNKAVMEERKVAASLNVQCEFNYLSSDRLPAIHEIKRLVRLLEALPRPVLIHCRGGVDRTGLASVMAAMAIGGMDYEQAKSQLSLKYFYVRRGTNINDLFQSYEKHGRNSGAGLGGWKEFRAWIEDHYKPSYYFARIQVPAALEARPGETVAVEARVVNGSYETLPLEERTFDLVAVPWSDDVVRWNTGLWGRASLPRRNLPPGGALSVTLTFQAPREPGTTSLCFDLEEVGKDRFAIYGSPLATCAVTVK